MSDAPLIDTNDQKARDNIQLRTTQNVIRIHTYVTLVFSYVSICITCAIIIMSTTLSPDRRAFFLCILGVCTLGLQIIICLARQEPAILLLFSALSNIISGLTLGLAVGYA